MSKKTIPQHLHHWIEARKRHHLSHAHVARCSGCPGFAGSTSCCEPVSRRSETTLIANRRNLEDFAHFVVRRACSWSIAA